MKTFFSKTVFVLLGMLLWSPVSRAQLLEMDFTSEKREESSFRVHLIRYGIVGLSSLKHIDLTSELLKIRYDSKKGMYWGLSVFGTQTIWRGNKVDALNTFDFLMNPIGGTLHGNLFGRIPIKRTQTQNSILGLSLGLKWIEGPPAPQFKTNSFFDRYARIGWISQRLIAEDPLANSSLSFWLFPNLQFHHSTAESRTLFFNNEIEPFVYGYGIELGLDYNTQLKIILHGQQLVNTVSQSELKRFVTRLTVAYRF
jgi:hypothetical protein